MINMYLDRIFSTANRGLHSTVRNKGDGNFLLKVTGIQVAYTVKSVIQCRYIFVKFFHCILERNIYSYPAITHYFN